MRDLRIQFDVYELGSRFWEENCVWIGDCGIEDIEKIKPIQYSDRYRIIFKPGFHPEGYETVIRKAELDKILEAIGNNTKIIDYQILNAIDWDKNKEARMEKLFEKLRKKLNS